MARHPVKSIGFGRNDYASPQAPSCTMCRYFYYGFYCSYHRESRRGNSKCRDFAAPEPQDGGE